jgi:hypothetical protein
VKLIKFSGLIAVIVISMICQSCGGSSNTSGTLTFTTQPTSVAAGYPLEVVATYANPNQTSLQGLPVNFTTNSASVASGSTTTDGSGAATIHLATTNNINADQTVVVTAQVGGLSSQSTSITLKANKLTITAPSTLAGTFPAGTISSIVPTGPFITYTDGNGKAITQTPISLSVLVLTPVQGVADANLYWTNTGTPTAFKLGTPITVTTDSNGVIDFATFYVSSLIPPSSDSTAVVVQFQAEANVAPGVNIITDSSSMGFTFTGQ